MAVQIMTDVWQYSTASGTRLLVLLAIADAADRQSRRAYPGLRALARYARISGRQVLAHIEALIAAGELERVGTGHRGRRAEYRVLVGAGMGEVDNTLSDRGKGAVGFTLSMRPKGAAQRRKGCRRAAAKGAVAASPLPTTEPTTEPTETTSSTTTSCDAAVLQELTAEGARAFETLRPRIPNLSAFLAEIRALVDGRRSIEPRPTWAAVSLALADMVTVDAEPRLTVLRPFVRKAAAQLSPNGGREGGRTVRGGGNRRRRPTASMDKDWSA